MAMKNFRVDHEDGTSTYFQFDESEDAGKAGLKAFKDAAKSKDSTVKRIVEADPPVANAA